MKKTSRRKIAKLKTCAAIGGAIAALPAAANATVITVPVNVTITNPGSYDLTISPTLGGAAINENGGPDLTFTAGNLGPFEANTVAGDNGTMYVVDSSGNPKNVQGGTVGPGDMYSAGTGYLNTFFGGNFDKNGTPGYLGFEVPVSGPQSYDYGYVKLSAAIGGISGPDQPEPPNTITLYSYTYDDTGAQVPVPGPEPASLALFAAGAIGIEIVRRRAKALKK